MNQGLSHRHLGQRVITQRRAKQNLTIVQAATNKTKLLQRTANTQAAFIIYAVIEYHHQAYKLRRTVSKEK